MSVQDDEHRALRLAEIDTEHRVAEKVKEQAQQLAATFAGWPHLYQWGDGSGGWIFATVDTALAEAGFHTTVEPWRPRDTLTRLASRDGWECHYCCSPLGWGHEVVGAPEVEHVIPRSRGGSNRLSNLVLACRPCNSTKASMTPTEWLGHPCCEAHP